jgi:hypothetical protein
LQETRVDLFEHYDCAARSDRPVSVKRLEAPYFRPQLSYFRADPALHFPGLSIPQSQLHFANSRGMLKYHLKRPSEVAVLQRWPPSLLLGWATTQVRHTLGYRMIEQAAPRQTGTRNALLAIGVGGFAAGTLDLLQACIQLGWDIPILIAGGLIGSKADQGGVGIYLLGIFLHFFIALSAAAIYYAASRILPFMTQYALVCGLYFGGTVRLVMHLIVLPLSALHATAPLAIRGLLWGLLQKGVVVGLPIAYSVRHFAKVE